MGTQGKRIDETGNIYGRLTVIEFSRIKRTASGVNQTMWSCKCECGYVFEVSAGDLRRKDERAIRSCRRCGSTRHGHCTVGQSPEYVSWHSMITRCTNKKRKGYKDYGGRGITVCDRWLYSFQEFLKDMGLKPDPSYTIERIENNKGYEPGNCRWATQSEQMRNTRHNTQITINGRTMILADWIKEFNINIWTYIDRVRRGMSPEESLTTPVRTKKSVLHKNQS